MYVIKASFKSNSVTSREFAKEGMSLHTYFSENVRPYILFLRLLDLLDLRLRRLSIRVKDRHLVNVAFYFLILFSHTVNFMSPSAT